MCIALVSVALLCAAPFLQPYHRNPLTAFYSEWLAVALGLGVLAVLLDRRTWSPAELPWAAAAPILFALLAVAHGALGGSPYFGQALTAALYLVWSALLIVAAHALVRFYGRDRLLAVIASGLATGALLGALAGVIQFTGISTPLNAWIAQPVHAAVFGNLAQANHYAAHTTLGLLSLAYLHVRGWLPLSALIMLAMPMLFVLGVSGSRSAGLYLLTAGTAAAFLHWRQPHPVLRRLLWVAACFFLAYIVFQLAVTYGVLRPSARASVTAVDRLFGSAVGGYSDRLALWQTAWAMFLAQPWFGAGWGAFPGAHFHLAEQIYPPGKFPFFHHAHNIVLHVLAETGVVGLVLLLAPLVAAGWRLRAHEQSQVLPGAPSQSEVRGHWLLLALAGVFVLHSLLEYPLWYAYFLGPAALLLGAAPGRVRQMPVRRAARPLVLAVLSVAAFNLALLWHDYRDFEAVFLQKRGTTDDSHLPALMARLHDNPLLQPYVEVASALPMRLDESQVQRQLFLNSRALRFVPQDDLVYRQVLLLALAGRTDEARALFARAQHAYPSPPADFRRDLQRLAAAQPALVAPLLESASLRALAQP